MDTESDYIEVSEKLGMSFLDDALFEQYDEIMVEEAANDDCYENLYPCMP